MIKKLSTKKNTYYDNRSLKKGVKQHISRKTRVSRMRKNVSQKTRKHHHRGGAKTPQSIQPRLRKSLISGPVFTSIIPKNVANQSVSIINPLINPLSNSEISKARADKFLKEQQELYAKINPYKKFIDEIILAKKGDIINNSNLIRNNNKLVDNSNRYKLVLQYIIDDDTRSNMTTQTETETQGAKTQRLINLIINTLNEAYTEDKAKAKLTEYNETKDTYASF